MLALPLHECFKAGRRADMQGEGALAVRGTTAWRGATWRVICLEFLAADIVQRTAHGEQAIELNVRRLLAVTPLPQEVLTKCGA